MVTGETPQARVYAASAAIVFALVVVGAVIAIVTNFDGEWEESPFMLTMLAFGLLGSLVLWRRPGNAMGWVFSAVGLGGQTLVSAVTRELAREGLPGHLIFHDLGEHELKDMTEPEQVYEIVSTTDSYPSPRRPVEPII